VTQIPTRGLLEELFRQLGFGEPGDMWYLGPAGLWLPVADKPASGEGAGYVPTLQADDSVAWRRPTSIDDLLFDDDGRLLLDDDGNPLLAD
jgi:hypothetical protein